LRPGFTWLAGLFSGAVFAWLLACNRRRGWTVTEKTLNHFSFLRFNPDFWSLPAQERGSFFASWESDLAKKTDGACTYFYQVSPTRADTDFLLWSALPADSNEASQKFFDGLARSLVSRRRWMEPSLTLWGYTHPSQYARGQSSQEIDPLQPQRKPFLTIYPFVKTVEWYLLSRDTRQGMMNQHIRIGHQYPEILQLLLYSFGLQDQEFVVVYEMDSLEKFSDLVNELRSSEARRYTERDTPTFTAIWHSAQELGDFYGQE
jgi:chlorite dismutase